MDVLIHGDTATSPALRHELPLLIGDPFLYLESDGRRAVLTNALEDERIAQAAPDVERLLVYDFGFNELIATGRPRTEIDRELCVRAVAALGITQAAVPAEFPLALADRLREAGVALAAEDDLFTRRRRRKTAAEMAGIRRAAAAAHDAMREAATMLREAAVEGDALIAGGEPLTAEAVRARIREVCARAGAPARRRRRTS